MKICWDNLEDFYLTRNGILRKGTVMYIEMDSCKVCGEPYLTKKHISSPFCSSGCANGGENNPFFGKKHTIETRKRLSEKSYVNRIGPLNSNWKGGIKASGLSWYETYKDKLSLYEDIRKQEGTEILEARCTYCGRWFTPKCSEVQSRLKVVNKLSQGEGRLYCSDDCKQECPTYGRQKYPKGFKKATSREVSTYLRQMVFERDNWKCQKCGKTGEEIALHCHHIDGYTRNRILANDMDSCITLCKDCHKEVHMQYGCRYIDLQCEKK